MNEHIKAGAEIHAGGGYREGTQEEYEAFMKVRNKSLAENRIKELIKQASYSITETDGAPIISHEFNKEKFAELIVQECIKVLEAEQVDIPEAVDTNVSDAWILATMNSTINHCKGKIQEHFGVVL